MPRAAQRMSGLRLRETKRPKNLDDRGGGGCSADQPTSRRSRRRRSGARSPGTTTLRGSMTKPDFDDPAVEEQWCADRRAQVERYLASEGVEHGRIGDWPAWHIAPYVSVWAIESKVKPGWVGWWVICGDLPTDYVSAGRIKHPRKAVQAIADRWRRHCESVRSGRKTTEMSIGGSEVTPPDLVPLLETRAAILTSWAQDDSIWEGL